ncbi:GNAT family N-acetyltransferase (plasmid) [Sulfitobacter sp. W027]|uniref:GNAT family N-acetyltransferase n=1 Tax=Sulfitobacter sp. W027 TaxID=2867025 RepID=UPI0021A51D46|nr:GNAT family N-acetyltransferase [Sulfitobacter sp. W027]UWR35215.1 GNAT family N-acetyltransferase [Sulfitobacter sp. W027]
MAGKQSSRCPTEQTTLKAADFLQAENDRLIHELRAFVSVALQHGLQDYCETRHPALTAEIRSSQDKSQVGARKKYADVLARISQVPRLRGETGHTGDRTYYRNAQDNVAYIEHAFRNRRFFLGGIWVAPNHRGQGIAHQILRVLVKAADAADLSVELVHEPFGNEGLRMNDLEAFYNRHGFTRQRTSDGGMVRFPRSSLDLYRGEPG